jgi:hypothetical protein
LKKEKSDFIRLIHSINSKLKKELDSYDDTYIELITIKIVSKYATKLLITKQFKNKEKIDNFHSTLDKICKIEPSQEIENLIQEYFMQYEYAKLSAKEFAQKYISNIKTDNTTLNNETKLQISNHLENHKNISQIKILDYCARDGEIIIYLIEELQKRGLPLKEIITNNIYAIEKSPIKYFIIKLRIWFEMICLGFEVLPNLEKNIFLGDSLIQTLNGSNIIKKEHLLFSKSDELIDNLRFEIDDISKVQDNIKLLLQAKYDQNNIELKSKIQNLQTFKSDINHIKKDMQRNLYNIELIKDMLSTKYLFILEIQFHKILQNGGFDMIISHLPNKKISQDKLLKNSLKNENYKCYSSNAYLKDFFVEKAQTLTKLKILI